MEKETISQTISHTDRDHNCDRQILRNMIYTRPTLKKSLLSRFSAIVTRKQKVPTRNDDWQRTDLRH